jgi:hypothetical protein
MGSLFFLHFSVIFIMSAMQTELPAPNQLKGLKFFGPIRHCLDELRAHHNHFNRCLTFDEYFALLLLAFFNPAIESLRGLVRISSTPLAERNLGLHHTSLGSLSEASHLFDPELLRRIFLELVGSASALDAPPRPAGVPDDLRVLAADATLWKLLPRMCRELFANVRTRARKGEFKGHFIFSVFDAIPIDVEFTPGTTDERHVLPRQLEHGALYLLDRGYQSFILFEQILQAGASFVVRLRVDCHYHEIEKRPLSAEALNNGVCSDSIVTLGKDAACAGKRLRIIRAVIVSPPPRNLDPKHKRGKYAGYARDEPLVQECIFLTDRMDLDASVVVDLYRYRWQIEIFFRWFKCVLKCKHLFAESENGMALQFYAALIASLLVVIHTGRKPNKMMLLSIQLYFQGWDTWEGVEREIARAKQTAK